MGQVTTTEVHDFTGGVNTVTAPHLIAPNEAQSLVNVDIRKGALASLPDLLKLGDLANGAHFFQFQGITHNYAIYRTNVIWDNKWYWSDGVQVKKVLEDGVTEKGLGLPTPTTAITQAAGAIGYPHTGDFKYTYTFYDEDTGTESAPAPLPNYITIVNNSIIISAPEALPADATHYRVYRIGGYLSTFAMVAQLTAVSFPYEDKLDDTSIDGRLLQTLYTSPPPTGLGNLVELNGRMYGTKGNLLYFSALGNPDNWYVTNFVKFSTSITGLAVTQAGLLVMEIDKTTVLRGTGIENFQRKRLSDFLGCVDHKSIAQIGKSAMWLGNNNWVMCDGYSIESVTYDKIEAIKGISARGAVVKDNVYYMVFGPALYPDTELYPSTDLYPNTPVGTSGVGQGTVTMDFKRGRGYSYVVHEYDSVESIGVIRDQVHFGRQYDVKDDPNCIDFLPLALFEDCNAIGFPDCNATIPCSVAGNACARHRVYDLARPDAEAGLTKLVYVSPESIDGSRTNLKEYEKVRVLFNGSFRVRVVFDKNDEIVVDTMIESETPDEDTFALIGIPKDNNKSYSITLWIEGVGTVDSIQYTWKPRELI